MKWNKAQSIIYIVNINRFHRSELYDYVSSAEIYNLFSVVKLIIRLFCFIPFLSASSKEILRMFMNSFMHA